MLVPINHDFRIASDTHAWTVQRSRLKRGQLVWESVAWHRTFDQAIRDLGERMVRTDEAVGLHECIEAVQRVCRDLAQALPEHVEVRCYPASCCPRCAGAAKTSSHNTAAADCQVSGVTLEEAGAEHSTKMQP